MIRTVMHWLGCALLGAAMALGVFDGARSLSVSGLEMTTIATATRWLAPQQVALIEATLAQTSLLDGLLSLPAGPLCFVLGGICLWLGQEKAPPAIA